MIMLEECAHGYSFGCPHCRRKDTQMNRTRLERETVYVWNDEEPSARLWTASDREVKRWRRLGLDLWQGVRGVSGEEAAG